jgi:DNA-binding NarL/FixJ family response regulator
MKLSNPAGSVTSRNRACSELTRNVCGISIVIEPAAASQSSSLLLETHGATPREREVATLVARGLTNPEIASELVISPHTVQDHIKSLFEKVGVGSRQELVARAFLDEYLPDVIQRTPLTSRGSFDRG